MKFTENQQKAISHYESPALVLAVPGAGKTTVLLNRIKYLEKVINNIQQISSNGYERKIF